MKCPHCLEGIHESFAEFGRLSLPGAPAVGNQKAAAGKIWLATHQMCPECKESIVKLHLIFVGGTNTFWIAYPKGVTRRVPPEVSDPYRTDFQEASLVLADSPKASAALSRRCLQAILRDKAGTTSKDLFDQIEEVVERGTLPSHIVEELHAVRNIGNFAAHTMKSTNTGEIIDVESGEAEWNLDVIESMFDFYFVQPARSAKRRSELNRKLNEVGKPEI